MKVLIVNPSYGKNFVRSARWAARSRGRVQRHPDYLAIAAAVLENEGHEVKLLDAASLNFDFSETKAVAEAFGPGLSIVHTTTPSIYNDVAVAEMLKGLSSETVLIGQHASALPEETMRLSNKIDFIARGEFDYTLRDIANGKGPADMPGITYRHGNEIISNGPRPLIQNMDELPFPAWHQIDVHDYFDAGKLFPFITLIGGRGCPNQCTFCVLPQVFYGKKYRFRSAKKVVDEIEYDLGLFPDLKEVMFEDDTLTADKRRCADICNEMIDRGLHKKISWSANARAELDDFGLMQLMRESGCRMLVTGFEFGDQQILDNVKKRITTAQMKTFTDMARKAGIKVHGCFMIGGPGETKETAMKTVKLPGTLCPDTLQFSAMTPYPGTEFYDWCKANGHIIAKDWTEWVDAGEQSTVIQYPGLTRQDMISLVDKGLYDNFYFKPGIWAHHLLTINSLGDLKRKAKGGKGLIEYVLRKEVNRIKGSP